MTDERLLQHARRHLTATAKIAVGAIKEKDIRKMQQRAEGVSDYPKDIVNRIRHQLHKPQPAVPPLPQTFDPGPEDESAKAFAVRCLTEAAGRATVAANLTNLGEIMTQALLILAFGDAAEVRLRIYIHELRENKKNA